MAKMVVLDTEGNPVTKKARLDVNGNPQPRLDAAEARLSLLIRVVAREEFSVEWGNRWSVQQIADKWEITISDVQNLRYYWALPDRERASQPKKLNGHKVKEDLEPWIRQLIQEDMVRLQNHLIEVIDQRVKDAVEAALS